MDDHCTVLTNLIACFILNFPNLFLFVEWCRSSIWWFFMAYDAVMIFLLVSSLSNKVWNTTNIINKTSDRHGMKQLLKRLQSSTRGAMDITGIVVDVVLVVALIPIIKTFIADAANLTATETALLVLVTLFIVIGLIVMVGRQTGLIHKKQ